MRDALLRRAARPEPNISAMPSMIVARFMVPTFSGFKKVNLI